MARASSSPARFVAAIAALALACGAPACASCDDSVAREGPGDAGPSGGDGSIAAPGPDANASAAEWQKARILSPIAYDLPEWVHAADAEAWNPRILPSLGKVLYTSWYFDESWQIGLASY